MRPYLSIIKDSFRAALASRVLYVLLFCITVFLLVLAPIWIKESLDWKIVFDRNVRNPDGMCSRLGEAGPNEDEELIHHLWKRISPDLQQELVKFHEVDAGGRGESGPEEPFGETGAFRRQAMWFDTVEELNQIIEGDSLYDEEFYKDRYLPVEASDLIEEGIENLNKAQLRRLNRKLVEYSLAGFIREGPASSLNISYLVWSPEFLRFNFTRGDLKKWISSYLPFALDKIILAFGMLIAVIITASLIPDMLQANSLNLLLSKPITRWGLLLSKFVGGCAFIAILAAYLFFGLWLLLGVRIGYWDKAILLSIPVYIFVFAIYFSVSTLFGVMFRNTIVSIILTFLFWVVCWAIGQSYSFMESGIGASKVVTIVEANDQLFHVDKVSMSYQWNEEERKWEMAMADEATRFMSNFFYGTAYVADIEELDLPPPVGPAYVSEYDVVVVGLFDPQSPTMRERTFAVTNAEREWKPVNAGYLPPNAVQMFESQTQGLLVIDSSGQIFRLTEDPLAAADKLEQEQALESVEPIEESTEDGSEADDENDDDDNENSDENDEAANLVRSNGQVSLTSNRVAVGRTTRSTSRPAQPSQQEPFGRAEVLDLDLFEKISSGRLVSVGDSRRVDMNPDNDEIAVYSRGTINILKPENGVYQLDQEIRPQFDVEASMPAWIAYKGEILFVALGNGELVTINRNTLEELNTYLPENRSAVTGIASSNDGRFFLARYRNGNLWYLDMEKPDSINRAPIRGQGSISGATFNSAGNLWVADRTDRLTQYDPTDWSKIDTKDPIPSGWIKFYRFGIKPMYNSFPKPGEFYKLISHLSDGSGVKVDRNVDLTSQPEPDRPWDPFRSGLIFVVITLFLACFIFQRQEY